MNFKIKSLVLFSTLIIGIGMSFWLSPKSKTLGETIFPYHSTKNDILPFLGKKVRNICYKNPRKGEITSSYEMYRGQFYMVITYDDAKYLPVKLDRYHERVCLDFE